MQCNTIVPKRIVFWLALVATLCMRKFCTPAAANEVKDTIPPVIQLQWPPEFFRFYDPENVVISVVVGGFRPPADGKVHFILDGADIAQSDQEANEFGEVRLTLNLPRMPDGFHDIGIELRSPDDTVVEEAGTTFQVESTGVDLTNQELPPPPCPPAGMCSSDEDCSGAPSAESEEKVPGRCVVGACVCAPDRFGERCEHNIFESAEFFPAKDPLTSPSRCAKGRAWSAGVSEMMDRIKQIQFPSSCKVENTMVFEAPTHGLGANLHYLTVALNRALRASKAMVLDGAWTYGQHGGCANAPDGHQCDFVAMTNCTSAELIKLGAHVTARHDHSHPPDSHFVFPPFDKDHGVLWYRSHLIQFMMQPNERLKTILRTAGNSAGIVGPYVGVQIRRGDSCAHAATSTIRPPCPEISQYLDAVMKMQDQYGVKNVFLATDDTEAVNSFKRAEQDGRFKLLSLPLDRSMFEGQWFVEYRLMNGFLNKRALSESTYSDLFMLANSDYFVGTFGSQFSRLAFELLVATKGYVPPYVSVDYPWCFHYMEPRRIGSWGEKFC